MPKQTILHEQLVESEERLRNGDKTALLDVLFYYIVRRDRAKRIPLWVTVKFFEAYAEVYDGHASSWDDVFGKPWRKRRRLDDLRARKSLVDPIIRCVEELREKQPVDERLFEAAAKRIGMGKRQVKEIYYAFRRGPLDSTAREHVTLNPKRKKPSH
jgi:hypothetical protein